MKQLPLTVMVLGFSLVFAACSANEDADSLDSEVTRRIAPVGATSGFQLRRSPEWSADDIAPVTSFALDGRPIALGETLPASPGQHTLTMRNAATVVASKVVSVDARGGSHYAPAALTVRREKPVTFGASLDDVLLRTSDRVEVSERSSLERGARSWLLFDGTYTLSSDLFDERSLVLSAGQRTDVVLPVSTVTTRFEPLAPGVVEKPACTMELAYPRGPSSRVLATWAVARERSEVVLLPGAKLEMVCGEERRTWRLSSEGGETIVSMHRLEVDDMHVTDATGASRAVPGAFTVYANDAFGVERRVVAPRPTSSGVDLPGGRYRVVVSAPDVSAHSEEVWLN